MRTSATLSGLTVTIGVLLAIQGMAPAAATFPGRNGRIAFERNGRVWTSTRAGHDVDRVSKRPKLDPAWSPDGTSIAVTFPSLHSGTDLFLFAADGSERLHVAQGGASDRDATWSPDGGMLAFTSDRNGTNAIYTLRLSDPLHTVRQLTFPVGDRASTPPTRSPRGRPTVI